MAGKYRGEAVDQCSVLLMSEDHARIANRRMSIVGSSWLAGGWAASLPRQPATLQKHNHPCREKKNIGGSPAM